MQIKENKVVVEGVVHNVRPAADGWGATAEVKVERTLPAKGFEDFLQAKPGSTIEVFVPDPDSLQAGKSHRLTITVLGGPNGERAVVQDAKLRK